MRSASAKAKGRRLQTHIRSTILAAFPELADSDVACAIMGEPGIDIKLSALARTKFPFAVEARNVERMNVWQCIQDAETHAAREGLVPLGVISRNRMVEPYAMIPLSVLIQLLKGFPPR